MKKLLYEEFLDRIDKAMRGGQFLEAAWYAYAVLEDRLRSMLRGSGGEGRSGGNGPFIRMLGPKLTELRARSRDDPLLAANLEYSRLDAWRIARNDLTHAMADGALPIEQIDRMARDLACEGAELARFYASAARRLKLHRMKVSSPLV